MKRTLAGLIVALALLGGLPVENAQTQGGGLAPTLSINLVLNSSKYLLNHPTINDPIIAEITIRNTGSQPIITSAGFSQQRFELFLTFIDPDGNPITATEIGQGGKSPGPPPQVLSANGVLVQVEAVEVLDVGLVLPLSIPDLRAFYPLTKAGRYSVKALIPVLTYPAIDFTVSGTNFSRIDSFNFAGALESNTSRFSLITDADDDRYAFPEPDSRISQFNVADCDDHDPLVNPGALEISGDGKDNDCNPSTLDEVVAVKIDIKPGTFPNTINLGSKGSVPVAILSTATFDATKVDPATITLEDAHVAIRGKGALMASFEDVNKDGRLDLVVHVETQALTLSGSDAEAVLTGKTFEVPGRPVFYIRGVDSIRVVP